MKLVGCRETPQFLAPGSVHVRTGQRGSFADLIVADRPIAGLSWLDYGSVIEALTGGAEVSRDETQAAPPRTTANRRAGVREYVAPQDGDGWWDYFRLSDHLSLSITEAAYRKDRWISVEGGSFFKIRVLLAGRLLSRDGSTLLVSPQALLHVCTGARGGATRSPARCRPRWWCCIADRNCSASAWAWRSGRRLIRCAPSQVPGQRRESATASA